ncbi:TPA: cellulase family glycosylhydrolase [Klebsiella pneumoniae]|nr:cellulase family glycosylhydrolase [Klebsiella pneumoniae]
MLNNYSKVMVVSCLLICKSSSAFILGIGIHPGNNGLSAQDYLKYAQEYGFNSVRTDFFWSRIENRQGIFNDSDYLRTQDYIFSNSISSLGKSALLVLDYGNRIYTPKGYPENQSEISAYVNYASRTAKRYKGKVLYYEIWNEWLQGTGVSKKNKPTADPKIYTELVKQTYKAIKAVDPNAIIMIGSINPNSPSYIKWLNGLINEGILDYCDAISIHTYFAHDAPLVSKTPEGAVSNIDKLEKMLKERSGRDIDLYITEMGYSQTEKDVYSTSDMILQNVAKFMFLAKSRPFIKGIWWYDLINDGDDRTNKEHNFGFLYYDKTPKKTARYIQSISSYMMDDSIMFSSQIIDDKVIVTARNKTTQVSKKFEWVPYGSITESELDSYVNSLSSLTDH